MCECKKRHRRIFPLMMSPSRVFVNGRDRATIMADMQARINRNDIKLEREEAIQVQLILFHCQK